MRNAYGDEAVKKLLKIIPGGMRRSGKGVLIPEVLTSETGYASADEMIADVMGAPTLGQRIKKIIQEKQYAHYTQFSAEKDLFDTEAAAGILRLFSAILTQKKRSCKSYGCRV